jgi:hypothetical protein
MVVAAPTLEGLTKLISERIMAYNREGKMSPARARRSSWISLGIGIPMAIYFTIAALSPESNQCLYYGKNCLSEAVKPKALTPNN